MQVEFIFEAQEEFSDASFHPVAHPNPAVASTTIRMPAIAEVDRTVDPRFR